MFLSKRPLLLIDNYFFPSDFQTPASPIMEGIIHFHHDLMILLTFICFFVLWMLIRTLQLHAYPNKTPLVLTRSAFSFNYYKHEATVLEIFWTVMPALILLFISIPSFALLYSTSSDILTTICLRVTGHQWYWTYHVHGTDGPNGIWNYVEPSPQYLAYYAFDYEYSSLVDGFVDDKTGELNFEPFDSYMIPVAPHLSSDLPRLVAVDNCAILPLNMPFRVSVTSDDVLHSWAVPALGIKVDACPGRMNSITTSAFRPGYFFGACSEICGVNHAFMPIGVAVMPFDATVPRSFGSKVIPKAALQYEARMSASYEGNYGPDK